MYSGFINIYDGLLNFMFVKVCNLDSTWKVTLGWPCISLIKSIYTMKFQCSLRKVDHEKEILSQKLILTPRRSPNWKFLLILVYSNHAKRTTFNSVWIIKCAKYMKTWYYIIFIFWFIVSDLSILSIFSCASIFDFSVVNNLSIVLLILGYNSLLEIY